MFLGAIPASANPDGPVFVTPAQYEEVPPGSSVMVTWNPPPSGTVVEYGIGVREIRANGETIDAVIINFPTTTSRSFEIESTYLSRRGYYKIAVYARMADGTQKWSDARYFYVAISKGIRSGNILSFKMHEDFSYAIKEAMYYSTRVWIDAIGEKVNTYHYDYSVSSTSIAEDGVNTIIPFNGANTDIRMTTRSYFDSDGYTSEADIRVNDALTWTIDGANGTFDVQNVMIHEVGHVLGLVDKYEDYATEWTMYGYSNAGETKRRTLHSYDLAAFNQLYY